MSEEKDPDSPSKEVSDVELLDDDSEPAPTNLGGDSHYDNEGELDYDELMETGNINTTATGGAQVR